MKDIQVDEKLFKLFIGWYKDNIDDVHSMTIMVADRINYFNKQDELIGYIYLYMGENYYIKESFYNMFTKA